MTLSVPTVGFVPLEAPIPAPRKDDLLAVSPPLDFPETRGWLGGGWSEGSPPGPAFTHDPCSTGTERAKVGGGVIASEHSRIFNVYLPATCTAQSVGPDPSRFIGRLEDAFRAYEGAAVERVLATGDGLGELGPHLGNDNMEQLAADPVDALTAMRLLETSIARRGSGIIHAAPSTVVAWDALHLTVKVGALTFSSRGTPIAVGAGYIGALPDGAAALEQDQQWAFASGPLEIIRGGEIEIPASTYEQILDRSMNDVAVLAERTYLFNWVAKQDPDDVDHTQAGVLVNETTCCCAAVISGGGP